MPTFALPNFSPMKVINQIGNKQLLEHDKYAFFTSHKAPMKWYDAVFEWVESLDRDMDCVMCCNTSEMEEEIFKALLWRHIPTILVVMDEFVNSNYDEVIEKAIRDNNLLIIVLKRDEEHGAGNTPYLRNLWMANNASNICTGYVSPDGFISQLLNNLRNRMPLFRLSLPYKTAMAAEPTHRHWTAYEDKTILRMYFNDCGLYATHKVLFDRSYERLKARIKSIVPSIMSIQGRAFEEYVLHLFPFNTVEDYKLLEWRSDKSVDDIYPLENKNPDFVIQFTDEEGSPHQFAIECKHRAKFTRSGLQWTTTDKISDYNEFIKQRNIPLFIALGIGDYGNDPKELYMIPFTEKTTTKFTRKSIADYCIFPSDEAITTSTFKRELILRFNPKKGTIV